MLTDGNAPCPCGSGKQYQQCHGAAEDQSQRSPDNFALNRALAYKGSLGQAREKFCVDYAAAKQDSIQTLEQELRAKAAAADKTISCQKGCNACCNLFVLATLQECDTIVHYLYQHDEALNHFRQSFEPWRQRLSTIDDCFQHLTRLQDRMMTGEASAEERQQYRQEEAVYAAQNLPCPFLKDDTCSIYEVRPYVCAEILSISLPEWCRPEHPSHQEMSYVKAELNLELDMPYFAPTQSKITMGSMPFLVFGILEKGWDMLALMPGLNKLKSEAFNDPTMRAALRKVLGK